MALIGRLLRHVHNGATELLIRPQDVGPLAEHVRSCMLTPLTSDEARRIILAGKLKMLGVPVRVIRRETGREFSDRPAN